MWQQGLLFKLKSYEVEGNFLRFLENYLDNRKQRLIFGVQCSSWKTIFFWHTTRLSFRATHTFHLHNNLPNDLNFILEIFSDDTSIFSKVFDKDKSQRDLSNDLSMIDEWAFQCKMQCHPDLMKFTFLGNLILMIIFLLT